MSFSTHFNFKIFEADVTEVLKECNYINLPFEISGVLPEVNNLLTKCGSVFFQKDISSEDLSECESACKVVLHIAWEKMNTGHWKDVDPDWRYAYTFASLFKVLCLLAKKEFDNHLDIIKACDMGLLMGAPLMKNMLSRIASKLSAIVSIERNITVKEKAKKFKASNAENLVLRNQIEEKVDMSHEDFCQKYLLKSIPILLVGAVKNWPALSSRPWSIEYILDKACFRTVPIEIGSKYTDDNWTQKLMTLEDFVYKYIWNKSEQKEIGYLAQHNLFDQIPELFDDLQLPSYITGQCNVDISVYFGPAGTVSPLHYDPKYNLLAQVIGEKYIRLYHEEESQYLYPRLNTWLSNTSQVDVENPNLDAFPLFSQAKYTECVLRKGDLLFIPPKCWHYVRSLSTSLSISFWW